MSGLRIGSLFSGYAGLDRAAEEAFGATTAWVSDIDPGACKILAHRYPDLPNHGDITKIDWSAVEPVDILTGGYPCQPFSAAGHRKGTDDERHLWPHVVEALSAMRPRFGVFENVRGHLSLGFDQVLRDLAILGYETRWCVLRAADVGAPHGRARIFILATDRHVRSGSDRRGGLHRDSGVGGLLSGAAQDRDDRQGPARAEEDAPGVRRHLGLGSEGSGPGARVACVEADGTCSGDCDRVRQPVAGREAGAGEDRPSVSVDGRLVAEIAEWALDVDGFDACEGCGVSDEDSGSEPRRSRPGAGATSCCDPAGDSSVGILVGGGGRPVRAGGVRGSLPDVRPGGGGEDVRDPDGFVYDADLVLVATDSERGGCDRGPRNKVGRPLNGVTAAGGGAGTGDATDTTREPGSVGHGDDVRARRGTLGRGTDAGRGAAEDTDSATRGERWQSAPGQAEGGRPRADAGRRGGALAADADRDGQQGVGRVVTLGRDAHGRRGADGTGDAAELKARTAATDTRGERHGRGQDRREVGRRVDGGAEGEARQRERARAESGDRGAEVAADAGSCGREGRRGSQGRELDPGRDFRAGSSGGTSWGQYAPAIERWQRILGRVAPAPTETSPKGSQRLSPKFVEWLMGLPEGWVTDVPDLNRNAQLKALGNGVVSQQAYAALVHMLNAERMAA